MTLKRSSEHLEEISILWVLINMMIIVYVSGGDNCYGVTSEDLDCQGAEQWISVCRQQQNWKLVLTIASNTLSCLEPEPLFDLLILQTMTPALRLRHISRLISTRTNSVTRSTRRSPALEHRRNLATSQPGGGSGEVGELGKSIRTYTLCVTRRPMCQYVLFPRHQTVGRQNGCRVSEPASPGFALGIYPLEHQSLLMYLRPVAVSTSSGVAHSGTRTATRSGCR